MLPSKTFSVQEPVAIKKEHFRTLNGLFLLLVNSGDGRLNGVKSECKEPALEIPVSGFKRGRKQTPYITLPHEAAEKHATDKRKCSRQRFAEDDICMLDKINNLASLLECIVSLLF